MATKLHDPFQDTLTELIIIYDMKTVIEAERLAVASKVLYFLRNNQGTSGANAVNNYIYRMLGEKKYYSYLKILEDFNEEIKKFKTTYYLKEDADRIEVFNKVDVFNFIFDNVQYLQYLVTTGQGGSN